MSVCPACGHENREQARFCENCGAGLVAAAPPREERKVVSVLFADLVGFTARAEQLDPEDVRALLAPYHERVKAELERFGGTVEKFIGDAVMALFGAPLAHEDDPERAVRAAIAIRDASLAENGALQVRIAITTGEVLVALGARPAEGEGMASGDVVNTAARLQGAAPVNGILVDDFTYRATRDAIEYREADAVQAKGKSEAVRVWEAVEARSRVAVERGHDSPLVGREEEARFVVEGLQRAKRERSPQLVTVVGVPGIGKSRLVFELFRAIEGSGELTTWRQGRALPYGEGVSFWPIAEIVKTQAGILETDPPERVEEKLAKAVEPLELADADWIAGHLRPLVGLAGPTDAGTDGRDAAFTAWRRFLEALAEHRPLVLVFEDLHWADEGVLDFVDHLVEWASGVAIYVLCTARPELLSRRPAWGGGKPNASTLSLSPLSDEETMRLLAGLTGRAVAPVEEQELLLAAAGGNPLYAEQYVRMLAERPDEDAPVPESVQGIIAARLDALPTEEKGLVQDAAVAGRTFWLGALVAVSGAEPREAEQLLHALERKEFVRRERRSSVEGDTEYSFRHVLVRDVAYGQIPRAARAGKHVRCVEWIESLGRTDDHAELLAHHWLAALELRTSAGEGAPELAPRARHALRAAGDRAAGLHAWGAAADYYAQALALEPDPGERAELLFDRAEALFRAADEHAIEALDEALATQLVQGEDERAAETETLLGEAWWNRGLHDLAFEHLGRALELIDGRPASAAKAQVLAKVSRKQLLAGHQQASAAAREALELAHRFGLAEVEATALNTLGLAKWYAHDVGAIVDLERSVEIGLAAGSPEVVRSMNNLGVIVEESGDFRRSIEIFEETARLAERFGDLPQVRWQQASRAWFDYYRGNWDDALTLADRFVTECDRVPNFREVNVLVLRAAIRVARGDPAGALADVQRAVELSRQSQRTQLTRSLGAAAWISVETGRLREARPLARELVSEIVEQTPRPDLEGLRELAPVADRLGIATDLLEQMRIHGWTPWDEAVVAVLEGDPVSAADIYAKIGATPLEAQTRLVAAAALIGEGRQSEGERELSRAVAFFRSVGAVHFLERCESLLALTA